MKLDRFNFYKSVLIIANHFGVDQHVRDSSVRAWLALAPVLVLVHFRKKKKVGETIIMAEEELVSWNKAEFTFH